ncbi:uncharacterized protein LOC116200154 [Punica granatum]|uniref:Uncharacterized protein n=2 Tax=Punica granatum TaxID=22663 RepID=A0A218XYU9_PUNGR|nr:uncharacterized protein LOC116200154 [Punica granatum]OWM89816.1 hypothetical protein CDL15_Pgr024565 [Punica granatum]PKI71585.1 hypothetical protein CRG98_008102 [Punica granatum]
MDSAAVVSCSLVPLSVTSRAKLGGRTFAGSSKLRTLPSVQCKALGDTSRTVYQGVYGPWTVDPSDVKEVILYRSGLVTAASSFVIASSTAFLPENSWFGEQLGQNLDLFYSVGAGGLGLSLLLIHIYVTEIKRTLQAFWALGVIGSLAAYTFLAQPAGEGLVQYVVENPMAVWFVGPLFAALTGLVFKEGLCYGKLEAGILTFIIPTVLLGHLTGLMDSGLKSLLLGSWMALFVIFAGRKFTQPIKDDIGDKSVFTFNSLPEDEKKALIEKLEEQKLNQNMS